MFQAVARAGRGRQQDSDLRPHSPRSPWRGVRGARCSADVAPHRAASRGGFSMKMLNGKDGRYAANEGVSLAAIASDFQWQGAS